MGGAYKTHIHRDFEILEVSSRHYKIYRVGDKGQRYFQGWFTTLPAAQSWIDDHLAGKEPVRCG